MIQFLKKIILFFFIFCSFIVVGFLLPDKSDPENMHYSIYDKHKLLENTTTTDKRIILIGGSNVGFGFYSPSITSAFNTKTINAGIHGGYGLSFMLDDILSFVQKNDIIIFSPEYEQFFGNDFYGSDVLIQLVDAKPSVCKSLSIKQWYLHLPNICKISVLKWRSFISHPLKEKSKSKLTAYERKSYNEFGDAVAHWNFPKETIVEKEIISEFNPDAMDYLLEKQELIQQKGAQLFIVYPSLNRPSFNKNSNKIEKVVKQFIQKKMNLLGSPKRYSFPDSLHFDSPYHLTKEGQLLRTKLLIEDLKPLLN